MDFGVREVSAGNVREGCVVPSLRCSLAYRSLTSVNSIVTKEFRKHLTDINIRSLNLLEVLIDTCHLEVGDVDNVPNDVLIFRPQSGQLEDLSCK
jgi:hypothetical protein